MSREDVNLMLLMLTAIGSLSLMPSLDTVLREDSDKVVRPVASSLGSYALVVAALSVMTSIAAKSWIPAVLGGGILGLTYFSYSEATDA